MLVIHERCMQKGIHRVTFNVMSFAKWKVLKAKGKLSVKLFGNLELGSMGKTIQCPSMDHLVAINPKGVGDDQKMGHNTNSPRGRCLTRCNTS